MISGQEIGAAVAVYRDGVKVVDLWGGYRNGITTAPWRDDTLVTMFSTTKGVSSLAVAVAASQGLISYDAKLADYWPEFAQADKGAVTVRQLLSHQVGLPARQARLLATHGGPGAWCPSSSRRHALGRPITRPKNRD